MGQYLPLENKNTLGYKPPSCFCIEMNSIFLNDVLKLKKQEQLTPDNLNTR